MKPFFYYHARHLAIDTARPWQLLSNIGAVCGKFATEEQAMRARDAMIADKEAGLLPCNLDLWDKKHLLEGEPS